MDTDFALTKMRRLIVRFSDQEWAFANHGNFGVVISGAMLGINQRSGWGLSFR